MKNIGFLAVIPFIGMFAGPILHNQVTPFIFGMPFLLAWTVIWVLLTTVTMLVIYRFDTARVAADAEDAP